MGPRHYFLDHFMRPSKFLAATALTALASLANAETFNFMYTFMDQAAHTVKGSFDGVRDGEWGTGFRVTQLTNVSVEVGAYKFADDHSGVSAIQETLGADSNLVMPWLQSTETPTISYSLVMTNMVGLMFSIRIQSLLKKVKPVTSSAVAHRVHRNTPWQLIGTSLLLPNLKLTPCCSLAWA